jgi:hypothetical protein
LRPTVVPYVLPTVDGGGLAPRHTDFLAQQDIAAGRPVIVAPVRVFRVKGVEIAISLLAAVRAECARRGEPLPYLLVFGTLDEDPDYAPAVLAAMARDGEGVRFLGGVPLRSFQQAGRWHLDEVDLLRITAATGGGVFYTPNRPDVESVGLGPALAAVAGVPFAATAYDALPGVYGTALDYAAVRRDEPLAPAASAMVDRLTGRRDGDPAVLAALARNRAVVAERFPVEPCRRLLDAMAALAVPAARR